MQQPQGETGVLGYARLTLRLRASVRYENGDVNGYFAFPRPDALHFESQSERNPICCLLRLKSLDASDTRDAAQRCVGLLGGANLDWYASHADHLKLQQVGQPTRIAEEFKIFSDPGSECGMEEQIAALRGQARRDRLRQRTEPRNHGEIAIFQKDVVTCTERDARGKRMCISARYAGSHFKRKPVASVHNVPGGGSGELSTIPQGIDQHEAIRQRLPIEALAVLDQSREIAD